MDSKIPPPVGLTLWKQSSMAAERDNGFFDDLEGEREFADVNDIDPGLKLMYLTNEGDLDGIKELLDNCCSKMLQQLMPEIGGEARSLFSS